MLEMVNFTYYSLKSETTQSSIHFFLPSVGIHQCKMEELIQDERFVAKTPADIFSLLLYAVILCIVFGTMNAKQPC